MISLILLKFCTFSQILQVVHILFLATVNDIQNGKCCIIYLHMSHISWFQFFLLNDEYRLLIPADVDRYFLTRRRSSHVLVCSRL